MDEGQNIYFFKKYLNRPTPQNSHKMTLVTYICLLWKLEQGLIAGVTLVSDLKKYGVSCNSF